MSPAATLFDLGVTGIILLSALGIGYASLQMLRLNCTNAAEQVWFALVCGLGLLSVGTLWLGLLGLSRAWLLIGVGLGGAGYGLWVLLHQRARLLRQSGREWAQWLWLPTADLPMRGLVWGLVGLAGASLAYALLTYALMPPYEWDELAYQLTLPKLYLAAGRIFYIPHILHSNWPLNSNMLFLLALAFGSDVATHLLMLAFAVLLAAGCVIFAAAMGDVRYGWLAAALILLAPLIWRLSGTATVDAAPALPALAAFFALQRWQVTRQWQWLIVSGAYSGFAAGGKVMAAGMALLLGAILVLDQIRHAPTTPRHIVRNLALFGGAALFSVGSWYARSWWYTGNPIWPLLYPLLGGRDWDLLGHEYLSYVLLSGVFTPQFARTIAGLSASYATLLSDPATMDLFQVGYGALLPLGVLGAVLLIPSSPRWLWQCLLVAGGWYLLWFFLVSHQLRFLLPGIAFAALPTSYLLISLYDGMCILLDHPRWLRHTAQVLAIGGLLWLASGTLAWRDPLAREVYQRREPYLRGQISRAQLIESRLPTLPILMYANTHLPPDARILLVPYEPRVYYLDRDFRWGNLVGQRVIRFETFATAAELLDALHAQGISHLIYVPDAPLGLRYEQQYYQLIDALRSDCSTLVATTELAVGTAEVIELRLLNPICTSPQSDISD